MGESKRQTIMCPLQGCNQSLRCSLRCSWRLLFPVSYQCLGREICQENYSNHRVRMEINWSIQSLILQEWRA